MSRIQWHLEKRQLSELNAYHKNPRIITEEKLKELGASFDECGNFQPIVVNTHNVILSGHARVFRMREEGTIDCEVMVPDRELTPKQEEAIVIRANKTTAGKWDFDILANEFELADLQDWGFEELDFPSVLSPEDLSDKNKEIDTDNFGNDLEHTCPKCGFEFNE